MKNNRTFFLGLTLSCGAAGVILRLFMIKTGLDEAGLLERGDLSSYGLWAVSLLFLLILALSLKKLGVNGSYADNFPKSRLYGTVSMTGGVLLVLESVRQILAASPLIGWAGVLAGVCMMLTGLCRARGERPSPAFHCIVCVFFILRLISSFRHWSSDPQLQDYAVQLMACVCLMLLSFHRTSCDAKIINRRHTVFLGLAAIYFCMVSVTDDDTPLLYLASGLWAFGSLCTLAELKEEKEN